MNVSFSRRLTTKLGASILCKRAASSITLHGSLYSQPSRSIFLLCKLNNIPYDFKLVDPVKGDTRKPGFKEISPTGLVPVIRDGDFCLPEAGAVLQYLCNRDKLRSWYPRCDEAQRRAAVDFWMSWHHTNTRVLTTSVLLPQLFPANPKTAARVAEKVETGMKTATRALAFMEGSLAASQSGFLAGSQPTIADLLILPEIDQHLPEAFGFMDLSAFPNVLAWVERMRDEIGEHYVANFEPVLKMAAKVKQARA
jgi:glutathione S-transferase